MKGSHLRASFGSMYCVTSKLTIVPANRVENAETSNASIGRIPLLPSRTFRQPSSTELPTGEISPSPVTTTRRFATRCPRYQWREEINVAGGLLLLFAFLREDVIDGLLNRRDLLGVLVRNLRFEFFLQGH